jgi:[acyl-carrier-protein] S-malonyltransferase
MEGRGNTGNAPDFYRDAMGMDRIERPLFLFPGQGAQYRGMALDFLDAGSPGVRELFDLASSIMGEDMRALIAESDEETLKRTDVSQPAITLANLAAFRFLGERGIVPAGCAGFSLGEYAALAAAGVIGAADCFGLVRERGLAMQAAAEALRTGKAGEPAETGAPGMAAVVGLPPERVEELIGTWRKEEPEFPLYAANFNSPRQTVVAGTAGALAAAAERFREAGARRFIPLRVAGPFHSPLMAATAERFRPFLEAVPFGEPRVRLFSNVTGGEISSGEDAKRLALAQITSPVRWVEEEAAFLASGGFDCLLETGPGKVLQGLWRDMGGALPCFSAGSAADMAAFGAPQ